MDKQLSQALTSLIPSLSGPLPPELLDLSASLLAQSRIKASNLKAEEEIARSYACANIACERLKQNLALPKIEPRPPCPPRIYKKLFNFLDSALPAAVRKSRQPSRTVQPTTKLPSQHIRPDNRAPSFNSRKRKDHKEAYPLEMPEWTMPVIRHMCKKLGALAAPHHILAGLSSILSSDQRPAELNIVALIITLYLLVLTRLTGVETGAAEYSRMKEVALEAIKEEVAHRGEQIECEQVEIDDHMRLVSKYHWTDMDWFENVVVGSGLLRGEDDQGELDFDDNGSNDEEGRMLPQLPESFISEDEEDFLQIGLGTMMSDRVDYLSDARRLSFERWKTETLHRIDELEARAQAGPVDEN